jgi:N-acetylglucosamine-6-phosphate deacetylase
LEHSVLERATITVENDLIVDVGTESRGRAGSGALVIDAAGAIVGPGFVDPHCHGDGKTRFFDDPAKVVSSLLRQGTTGVLATLGYPDMERNEIGQQLERFSRLLEGDVREVVAGVHLEGPYVNRKYGAQTSRGVIKDFDPVEYRALASNHGRLIRWWTFAPELPGSGEFIAFAAAQGHVLSAGHTEATVDQVAAAVRQGLRVITHWTNATGNPNAAAFKGTRLPGIDEAALVYDELSVEVIPDRDGRHVHPVMARLAYKAKGPDRVVIITDAGYSRPDDPVDPKLGALDVSIDADGNLAGSRLTMAGAARNFHAFSGCSLPELFRMASLNAARILGLDARIGSIEAGKLGNLVMLDDEFRVIRTFLRGREVRR